MRFPVFLFSIVLFNFAFAGNTKTDDNKAPVLEPISGDIGARLQRIERILDNQSLLNLLDTLESLEIEVSKLRGTVEVQSNTIEQLKQRQRDLYTDIDQRLQQIETDKPDTATLQREETTAETTATTEDTTDNIAIADNSDAEEKPPADPNKAGAIYQRAFKLLKESQYDQALDSTGGCVGGSGARCFHPTWGNG